MVMLVGVSLCACAARADEQLGYNRDVRPILVDKCFACHGPDSAAREADLRLDQRDAAIDAGAIEPGDPDSSELIARVYAEDPDEVMPPPTAHKTMSAEEKELLKRWIAQGAPYQPHWSFIAPERPSPPAVQRADWIRSDIDRFVLARLEAAGLEPAPEADRSTLIRRASLDLTGLPPAPDLVAAFLADPAPDAYEKAVDQLLQTPAWGEHRARYWLDYARYADTHGIHFDNYREMWSYRDWLIKAFNANMPFDQFTIESLAGDLLPAATLDQQIASGFHRCNMTTNEGGIIDEEYLVLYARDRTETTAQVWMGLTANCATCHDHKFDPLSQREFYELSAFFNNTTQGARDGNVKDTPPVVVVPRADDRERWAALQGEIPASREALARRRAAARADFDAWLVGATVEAIGQSVPADGLHLHAPLNEGTGPVVKVTVDGAERQLPLTADVVWTAGQVAPQAIQLGGAGAAELADAGTLEFDEAFSCGAWIRLPAGDDKSGAIVARMDESQSHRGWDLWTEGRRLGTHIIHQWSSDALKVVTRDPIPAETWTHVLVTYDGSRKASGVQVYVNGDAQPVTVQADSLQHTIRTDVPLKIGQRHASAVIPGLALQDLRLYRRVLPAHEARSLARGTRLAAYLAAGTSNLTDAQRDELFDWWLSSLDELSQQLSATVARLEQEEKAIRARGTIAHVMQERQEAATAYLLFRGEYDQRRDPVTPDTPEVLPPLPGDAPRNRLGLARWLVSPEHPLTARVTVNRFWQEVFGTGLVKTSGDFGISGELPSHPELLDWLAVDFREHGWDVKRLFRQFVTSATYRQAATVTREKRERDPENRLLSRGPRFRMDAEMVRDYALAASGLLVPTIGGASVKPYQPPGVWEAIAMNVSDTRSYERQSGDNLYRRSMYTFWKRMAPPASMEVMNAPNREFCVVRRERTNTPLQALVTLNDEQFLEAARHLAQRAVVEGGSGVPQRLDWLGLRLVARPFRADETTIISRSLQSLHEYYAANPEDARRLMTVGESPWDTSLDAAELAAWTMLINQLMNLDEVLNK
jgi:hypothetical protein